MKMRFRTAPLLAISLITTAVCAAKAPSASPFTPAQRAAIEQIVHQTIVKHPEILVEASQALREKTMKAQESKATTAIKANKTLLFNDPHSPSTGNPKAHVNVVEFFDYQCGHCRAVAPVVTKLIAQNPKVRFIFKELPIFGGDSKYAAQAALAANAQGHYIDMHNKLFTANGALSKDQILQFATAIGVDHDKLAQQLDNPAFEKQIKANFKLAGELGIMGTPAFIIGNIKTDQYRFIPGATSQANLQKAINDVTG